MALNELSRLHIRQSDFARAEPILLRLVKISRAKGDRHPDVATALAGLAVAKRGLGDDIGAELLFRRALRMREESLAPNHMATVITLEQLSDACAARGKYAEALVHLQRALLRRERTLGTDHATVRGLRARIAGLERRHAEWAARAAERFTDPTLVAIPSREAAAVAPPADAASMARPADAASGAYRPDAAPAARATDEYSSPAPAALVQPVAHQVAAAWNALVESASKVSTSWRLSHPSRRKKRYASGVAAVVVLTVAGFAFRSPSRSIELAEDSTAERMALLAARSESESARHDPLSVTSASGAYDAGMGANTLTLASNGAGAPAIPAALPRLRKLVVPKVAMPSLDSALHASTSDEPVVGAEPIGATGRSGASALADEASVTPPQLVGAAPTPRYPDELRTQRMEGDVVVTFRVNEKGRAEPSTMQVAQSPHPLFSEAVRNALPRFRFEPAHAAAEGSPPLAAWVQFRARFTAQQ